MRLEKIGARSESERIGIRERLAVSLRDRDGLERMTVRFEDGTEVEGILQATGFSSKHPGVQSVKVFMGEI